VRILARILSLPLGLLSIGAGLFGLLVHYGSQDCLARTASRQLQAFTRWAIDQGVGLPRDFASSAEEVFGESLLRFVMLPGGLVLLAFASGLIGAGN